MKVLTVCSHGNVRSVALAYILKVVFSWEAIPIGLYTTTEETRKMLVDWADLVIVTNVQDYKDFTPKSDKIMLLDLGHDVWKNPFHQELQHKILKHIRYIGKFDKSNPE